MSFTVLHTLWAFRTGIYILKYILKKIHQHSYGFQNLMSSWGWGSNLSNIQAVSDFSIFGSKSSHVQGVILKFWVFFFFNFRLGILKDAQVPDSFDGITIGRCVHHIFILKV